MRKSDSNLLLGWLVGWLVFLCALTHCSAAEAGERADYVAEQMAAYGIPPGVVPAEWVSAQKLRRIANTPWHSTTYGLTQCELYPDSETGRHFVACRVYLSREGKLTSMGGWRDTVRHELCHVLAASSVAGTIPADWDVDRVSAYFAKHTRHDSKAFTKCALSHGVILDSADFE